MTSLTDHEVTSAEAVALVRSSAHARSQIIRPAQRFLHNVTDVEVARVVFHLELGVQLHRGLHRWYAPAGHRLATGTRLTYVVNEMIRTGLLTCWEVLTEGTSWASELVLAPVHLCVSGRSSCHFDGEEVGAMRARLVDAEFSQVVDCTECIANATREL